MRTIALLLTAIAIGVVWLFGFASFYRLITTWSIAVPFEIATDKWWADGIGHFNVSGLRIYEVGSSSALVEGNFSVTYNPWRVWFAKRQDVTIQGKNINSKYLSGFLKGAIDRTGAVGKLDAQVTIESDGSIVVKHARAYGPFGEGTAAGSINKEGILDLESTWVFGGGITNSVAGVIKDLVSTSKEPIANSNYPTVIHCFLQGNVERPTLRLVSNLFQVELG